MDHTRFIFIVAGIDGNTGAEVPTKKIAFPVYTPVSGGIRDIESEDVV